MRHIVAPILCLLASGLAVPQQTPVVEPLNRLCSVQFDWDNTISPDSTACLALLASTLKVSDRLQLLLTGTPAHTAAVKDYLVEHESISFSEVRTASATANEAPNSVQSSLVKPRPVAMATRPVMAAEMAMVMSAAPPPPRPAASAGPHQKLDPYALGDQAAAWKASLNNGAIEYNVPPTMVAQRASTVTVVVHGYKDPNPHVLASAPGTVNANLKVSDMMQVELVGSPTEFAIAPQATQATQFVPIDGYATWIWSVTPSSKASAQQLTIKVSLVPDAQSGLPAQPLAQTPYTVNVTVESLWSVLGDRWHQDPMKAIEYILPGGAGWAALGTLLTTLGVGTWLRKKLSGSNATAPVANQNATPAV